MQSLMAGLDLNRPDHQAMTADMKYLPQLKTPRHKMHPEKCEEWLLYCPKSKMTTLLHVHKTEEQLKVRSRNFVAGPNLDVARQNDRNSSKLVN